MLQNIGGNAFLVIAVLVFIAVMLLLEGCYLLWRTYKGPEAKKIEARVRALSAIRDNRKNTQVLKKRLLSDNPIANRLLLNTKKIQQLDEFIVQAGLHLTVAELLLLCISCTASMIAIVLYVFNLSIPIAIATGFIFGATPLIYVSQKRNRRLGKFETQLPDALDLMIRALRAGHAFPSALQMVGDEMPEPIAAEFRIVHDEVNFGVALQQALTNMSERIPLTDLRYFIVSVLIQRESGGNLTEVLGNLSRLIRDRLKLMAKVKVLSSEGRLSAWILGLMPFILAGLMYLVNPGFMTPLWTDPIGHSIIQYTLTLMAFGVVVLRKIIRIRV